MAVIAAVTAQQQLELERLQADLVVTKALHDALGPDDDRRELKARIERHRATIHTFLLDQEALRWLDASIDSNP